VRKILALYGLLCALAVVAGLYPSIYFNVRPWWQHDSGMAMVQLILSLIAAAIPLVIFRLHWAERIFFVAILLGVLRVSVANGIESITLTRSEITSGREDRLSSNKEWTTTIERWVDESKTLKARYTPVGDEKEYTPTSQETVEAKREGRDSANKERDTSCKVSRVSTDCRSLTAFAEVAQAQLVQVIQNYGLTQRIDKLEHDIGDARSKLSEVGSAPPDYLGKARDALEGAWFNPLQNREMWTAYMAEAAAAGAPKLFVYIVSLLFAAALGENWWRMPQFNREVMPFKRESLPAEQESPQSQLLRSPPDEPPAQPRKPFAVAYVPGVRAWVEIVRPVPGGPKKRYTPSQMFPHYREFCNAEGFTPCKHVTTLGSLFRAHSGMAPVAKTGGQSHYELNIEPKLALVKA
jgi:hypothetical protein